VDGPWRGLLMSRWLSLPAIGLMFGALRAATWAVPLEEVPWPPVVPDDRPRNSGPEGLVIPSGPWTLLLGASSSYLGFNDRAIGVPILKQSLGSANVSDLAAALRWDLEVSRRHHLPDRVVVAFHRVLLVSRRDSAGDPCLAPVFVERGDPDLEAAIGCEPQGPRERAAAAVWHADPWARRRTLTLSPLL
jgi:hypothetical protein